MGAPSGFERYGPATYGDAMAEVYDQWYPSDADTDAAVGALAGWVGAAGGGAALELGVGTGRIAIALARLGIAVTGVDTSAAMIDQLRANARAAGVAVEAAVGDMASNEPPGPFVLVFVVANTLFGLPSAAAQQQALHHACRRLVPRGRVVIEAFIPADPAPAGDTVTVRDLEADRVVLDVTRSDPSTQQAWGQHIEITDRGIRLRPWHIRYAPPAELDALAAAAGLVLAERYGGWRKEPFTDESVTHVSVYRAATVAD